MATYQTYTLQGFREDLSNVIYNISPTDTPFLNTLPKNTATAVKHEWQTDSLASVGTNALVEGANGADITVTPTTRLDNLCQISGKTIKISGTVEAVSKAGRKSEKAYQLAKVSAEIKRDMEAALLSNTAKTNGNSSTARGLGGLQTWLATNKDLGGGAGAAGGTGTQTRTSGGQRNFDQKILNNVIQQTYTSGGSPTMLLVNPIVKVKVSAFTGIATRFRDVPAKQQAQIIAAADIFVSDFGTISIVPDRFIPNADNDNTCFLLDPEMAAVSYLRPFQTIELAKQGDHEMTQLLVEYTLEVRNEAAHGIISDLNTVDA